MNEAPKTRLPGAALTVVIRDDSPMIHCGDSPSYRTVSITLGDEQRQRMAFRNGNEEISRAIIEPETEGV
jgi:hypothetical protein